MRTLRIEVLDEKQTLRLVDGEGVILGRRSVRGGEVDALVEKVSSVYEGPAPPLAALAALLHWAGPGCREAVVGEMRQTTAASSAKAWASRSLGGTSTASS